MTRAKSVGGALARALERLRNHVVPLAAYDCLLVDGGPLGGSTFTPLWDHVPGQRVRLVAGQTTDYAGGYYRISDDGKRVEWRRL